MSSAEILAELPKLSPDEVASIYQRAGELLSAPHAGEEAALAAAVDEADACLAHEDVPAAVVRDRIAGWARSR